MPAYTAIHILYNPNSTGPGKELSKELYKKLRTTYDKLDVELTATKHAGHAEDLTYQWASASKHPLIISVSGDGGYHEVVNGAAKAIAEGKHPITAILPAGNANDHFTSFGDFDLYESIVAESLLRIDLLKLSAEDAHNTIERLAHSYIGLGITPNIGKQLTAVKLNMFSEAWIVLRGLLKPRFVRIVVNGKTESYDNVVISNIDRMAKYLKLSKNSSPDDGKFELSTQKHVSRLHLYRFLRQATTHQLIPDAKTDTYSFSTIRQTLVQLDGEVITIPGHSDVTITINKTQLTCIGPKPTN